MEWRDDTVELIKTCKSTIGKRVLLGLCANRGDGSKGYWGLRDDWELIFAELDGIFPEAPIRWAREGWRPESCWRLDIDYLKRLGDLPNIKIFFSQKLDDTNETALFVYSSFLLAIRDFERTYISYGYQFMETGFMQGLLNLALGIPIEEYHKRIDSNIYERDFSGAKVLVNPTSRNYTVDLNRNYKNLDGRITSRLVLTPFTGAILLTT